MSSWLFDIYGSYEEYLASEDWENKKKWLKKKRCEVCGSKKRLDLHHKTYERAPQEKPGDLITLCKRCHNGIHKK